MALPASGAISFNNINTELGLTATAQISLNDTAVRTLFGVSSGAIAMNTGYGKANRVTVNTTLTFDFSTYNLTMSNGGLVPYGYIAGKSDVILTIASGVYVYAGATIVPALDISGLSAGDTFTLINNGYIVGCGGVGGAGASGATGTNNQIGSSGSPGSAGGPAISLGFNMTLINNGVIGGGGGGGGGGSVGLPFSGGNPPWGAPPGGGGGGGAGSRFNLTAAGGAAGGAGGTNLSQTALAGSSGTSLAGGVGGRGGKLTFTNPGTVTNGGAGGGLGTAGSTGTASGISGKAGGAGGAAGKAINLNGYTVTYQTTGTIYGAAS